MHLVLKSRCRVSQPRPVPFLKFFCLQPSEALLLMLQCFGHSVWGHATTTIILHPVNCFLKLKSAQRTVAYTALTGKVGWPLKMPLVCNHKQASSWHTERQPLP